jgi:hypothetical protein
MSPGIHPRLRRLEGMVGDPYGGRRTAVRERTSLQRSANGCSGKTILRVARDPPGNGNHARNHPTPHDKQDQALSKESQARHFLATLPNSSGCSYGGFKHRVAACAQVRPC